METYLAVITLEGLVLYFESVGLMILFPNNISLYFVYRPQLHFMPLCELPHGEIIRPSIILKRISSKK